MFKIFSLQCKLFTTVKIENKIIAPHIDRMEERGGNLKFPVGSVNKHGLYYFLNLTGASKNI